MYNLYFQNGFKKNYILNLLKYCYINFNIYLGFFEKIIEKNYYAHNLLIKKQYIYNINNKNVNYLYFESIISQINILKNNKDDLKNYFSLYYDLFKEYKNYFYLFLFFKINDNKKFIILKNEQFNINLKFNQNNIFYYKNYIFNEKDNIFFIIIVNFLNVNDLKNFLKNNNFDYNSYNCKLFFIKKEAFEIIDFLEENSLYYYIFDNKEIEKKNITNSDTYFNFFLISNITNNILFDYIPQDKNNLNFLCNNYILPLKNSFENHHFNILIKSLNKINDNYVSIIPLYIYLLNIFNKEKLNYYNYNYDKINEKNYEKTENFKINGVLGDGNCFFNCFEKFFKNFKSNLVIRREICDFLKNNKDLKTVIYKSENRFPTLNEDSYDMLKVSNKISDKEYDNNKNYAHILSNIMMQNGIWANSTIINIPLFIYNINIEILIYNNNKLYDINYHYNDNNNNKISLILKNFTHYELLEQIIPSNNDLNPIYYIKENNDKYNNGPFHFIDDDIYFLFFLKKNIFIYNNSTKSYSNSIKYRFKDIDIFNENNNKNILLDNNINLSILLNKEEINDMKKKYKNNINVIINIFMDIKINYQYKNFIDKIKKECNNQINIIDIDFNSLKNINNIINKIIDIFN